MIRQLYCEIFEMLIVENVHKRYRKKPGDVEALVDINLTVEPGQFVVVRGPSGSGKSTLLMAIGGMLRPTEGRIVLDDQEVYALNIRQRAMFRSQHIGFIFQMFHLIPYLSVIENVALAVPGNIERKECEALLERLGLADRRDHRPSELSAGERQRTAVRCVAGHLRPGFGP